MRWIAMQLRSKTNKFPFKILEEIGFARVPILKLQYEPTGLELDLSFNSVLSESKPLQVMPQLASGTQFSTTSPWHSVLPLHVSL